MPLLGSHTASSSMSSSPSKRSSVDSIQHADTWSATTGSPVTKAQDDATHVLEDIDEHEHLLKETDFDTPHGRVSIDPSDDGSNPPDRSEELKDQPVTWSSLPHKGQLFLLMLARCSEPLTQTSLQAYMYYQLQSFDPSLSDSTIASQVGFMQGSFTVAQFITAFLWGRIADSPRVGRKRVVMIGLLGTGFSALGFGFSRSFTSAILFRCIGGALNGNVGVMRTMISEMVKEKRYQSRAFMILPMTFNIGVIIGPTLGGLLADPVHSFPNLFGPGSRFGGDDGVWWMEHWPYALPNIVSACFMLSSTLLLLLGLDETHYMRQHKPDWGRSIGRAIERLFRRSHSVTHSYSHLSTSDPPQSLDEGDIELPSTAAQFKLETPKRRAKLPFWQIFTPTVLNVFLAHALLAFHVGTFNNLWFIFLSAPRFDPEQPDPPDHHQHLPFNFTGGFAMPPSSIGLSLSIIGVIGITLQVLVYPWASTKFGNVTCYRATLALFPIVYLIAPYLSLVKSTTAPPAPASGAFIWLSICSVLFLQVLARTFALPANIILINNCCPHPNVLSTVHGLSQSLSSGVRTLGPVLGGWLFGCGLQIGVIGLVWWVFSIVAMVGFVAGLFVREGSGHEIFLPGEEEELAEQQSSRDRR